MSTSPLPTENDTSSSPPETPCPVRTTGSAHTVNPSMPDDTTSVPSYDNGTAMHSTPPSNYRRTSPRASITNADPEVHGSEGYWDDESPGTPTPLPSGGNRDHISTLGYNLHEEQDLKDSVMEDAGEAGEADGQGEEEESGQSEN